jgi:hypothetical protein
LTAARNPTIARGAEPEPGDGDSGDAKDEWGEDHPPGNGAAGQVDGVRAVLEAAQGEACCRDIGRACEVLEDGLKAEALWLVGVEELGTERRRGGGERRDERRGGRPRVGAWDDEPIERTRELR